MGHDARSLGVSACGHRLASRVVRLLRRHPSQHIGDVFGLWWVRGEVSILFRIDWQARSEDTTISPNRQSHRPSEEWMLATFCFSTGKHSSSRTLHIFPFNVHYFFTCILCVHISYSLFHGYVRIRCVSASSLEWTPRHYCYKYHRTCPRSPSRSKSTLRSIKISRWLEQLTILSTEPC